MQSQLYQNEPSWAVTVILAMILFTVLTLAGALLLTLYENKKMKGKQMRGKHTHPYCKHCNERLRYCTQTSTWATVGRYRNPQYGSPYKCVKNDTGHTPR